MLIVYRFLLPDRLLWMLSLLSILGGLFKHSNVCPFHYMAFAGNGKVWSVNRLTTSVEWL